MAAAKRFQRTTARNTLFYLFGDPPSPPSPDTMPQTTPKGYREDAMQSNVTNVSVCASVVPDPLTRAAKEISNL